jgi:4-hydroxy-2-oxoheptanedioate aldolase
MNEGAHKLRAKWAAGETVFGPFVQTPAPGMVEIFGFAGFDLCVVDLEHGPIDLQTAENMIRAAEARGIASGVRVAANRPETIGAALALGADAVLVPHVVGVEQARAAVDAARFAPLGSRGVCPFVRSASYSKTKDTGYYEAANDAVIVMVLLEGTDALENLDALFQVEGLDVVAPAPYDLSQSLGVTGQIDHPLVLEALTDACERAKRFGKQICFFVEDPADAQRFVDMGIGWITCSVDTHIITKAAERWTSVLDGRPTAGARS